MHPYPNRFPLRLPNRHLGPHHHRCPPPKFHQDKLFDSDSDSSNPEGFSESEGASTSDSTSDDDGASERDREDVAAVAEAATAIPDAHHEVPAETAPEEAGPPGAVEADAPRWRLAWWKRSATAGTPPSW